MGKEKITKSTTKKMSPYNMFMKSELVNIKKEHAGISHKEAFKMAAQNWSKSSDNPKNKDAKKEEKKEDKKEEKKEEKMEEDKKEEKK